MHLTTSVRLYLNNYTGLPATSWSAIILNCLQAVAIGICFFLSIYFVKTLDISIGFTGVLISVYGIGTIFGGMIVGRLCDKFNLNLIAIICLSVQSLIFFSLSKWNHPFVLVSLLFALGFSAYGFKAANDVNMLRTISNSKLRLKVINIARVSSNLGLGISGILIGLLEDKSFDIIFNIFGFILALAVTYLFFYSNRKETTSHFALEKPKLSTMKTDNIVAVSILCCLFLVGLLIAQLSATYPIYIHDAFPTLATKAVSILFLLDSILIIFLQAPLVNMFSKLNRVVIAGCGAFLMGLGMLILSYSHQFSLAIFSCIIWTTGEMLFMPMAQLICYENSGNKQKGKALGNFQAVYALSAVLGPIAGSSIYGRYGANFLWLLCGIIGFFCLLCCLIIKNRN